MAGFDYTTFQKWSQGDAVGANNQWNYTSATDDIATITTSGYFNPVVVSPTNTDPIINVGDIIFIVATDQASYATFTAVTPNVTVSVFDVSLGAGAVGTTNLAANAVTAAKIANNTITDTQVADNGLTDNSLALDTIQYTQVAMTAAQWNAMSVTPFQILAAPGAGLIYQVDNVWYDMTFVAAQYAAGGVVNLQYDNTATGAGVGVTADTAAATVTGLAASSIVIPGLKVGAVAQSTTVNKGLYMSNKSGAFTTGDGTWKINVAYRVITA